MTAPPWIFLSFVSGSRKSRKMEYNSSLSSARMLIVFRNSLSNVIRCSSTERCVFWKVFFAGNGICDIDGNWKLNIFDKKFIFLAISHWIFLPWFKFNWKCSPVSPAIFSNPKIVSTVDRRANFSVDHPRSPLPV